MQEQLNHITRFIEEEIKRKQEIIDQQSGLIKELENSLIACREKSASQELQLKECQQHNDGNRQLINKLLGDLSRLQQDLEWYKRTYETRSFLGTIKEKLRRKK